MRPLELLGAGIVLIVTLGAGTIAHELSHAIVLRAFGVPHDIEWLPDRDAFGLFGAGVFGTWATVTPRAIPRGLSPWGLRLSAVAPLALAAPLALVFAGVLPDPFLTGNTFLGVAVVGWLGCALPSPRDFSLFCHADRIIAEHTRTAVAEEAAVHRRR